MKLQFIKQTFKNEKSFFSPFFGANNCGNNEEDGIIHLKM